MINGVSDRASVLLQAVEGPILTIKVSNKKRNTHWKIAHRVLPTALSLNRMGILDTPYCHCCGSIDNIEHALLECKAVNTFWGYVNQFSGNFQRIHWGFLQLLRC